VPARERIKVLLIALTVVCVGGTAGAALALAGPNPPGNNGTIKVDAEAFDDASNNQPHVDCRFQIDFYGFDEGDLDATVTFESHPPTGPVTTLLTDSVFIGGDDNFGGGSERGLDASETYTLAFAGLTPHEKQGFHVRLTIEAEGAQGADTRHKTFWVTPCPPPPTTSTTTTTSTTVAPSSTTSSTTTSTTASTTTSTTSSTTTSTTLPPPSSSTTTTTTPPSSSSTSTTHGVRY